MLLFRDYTFNLGMRKWLRANNWAPWCLQRQNINSLCSATHWVKELIDTKTVLDMKWAKWRQYCCALVVVLVCNTRNDFPWIIYLSLYYNFHHDWDFRTAVETHLISLSSRSASFFCFLISSRLRRASARSLTARSRSRRRLSHRVLGKERRREVYQPVIIGRSTTFDVPSSSVRSLYKNPYMDWPYAFPLCHYFVPLLKGPVSSTFGHLGLLCGLLQFLGHGLILFPQHLNLLIGSFHVQGGRVLFLRTLSTHE